MPKVLVIEDDPTALDLLRGALEAEGCEVRWAAAAHEALVELARGDRPDLVLFDVHAGARDMPVIAALRRAARAPLVAITGLPPASVPRDLPAEAVLFKPFSLDQLRRYLPAPRPERSEGAGSELFG